MHIRIYGLSQRVNNLIWKETGKLYRKADDAGMEMQEKKGNWTANWKDFLNKEEQNELWVKISS